MIIIHLQKLFNIAIKEKLSYEISYNKTDKLIIQKKKLIFGL